MHIPTIIFYPDERKSVCSYWRCITPLAELSRSGQINLIEGTWQDEWDTLKLCDIAFFQRPMNKECLAQILRAKDLGLKIIIDIDDTPEVHPSHPVYDAWSKLFDELSFKKMMLLADVVITTTEYLKNYFLKYSNNVVVVPNAIDDSWLPFNRQSSNKIVFWRGGSHHLSDIYEYRNEIIKVMSNHKDWELQLLGSEVKFLQDKLKNCVFKGDYRIHEYFGYIIQTKPSICIVPLIDTDLNYGKSNISWQESTLCGSVSLTPYYWGLKGMSEPYKDKKSFKEGFERLISDQELRTKLYDKSLAKVKSSYVLSKVNKQRLQIIKNLL